MKKLLALPLFFLGLFLLTGCGQKVVREEFKNQIYQTPTENTSTLEQNSAISGTTVTTTNSMLPIDRDLGLFRITDSDKINNFFPQFKYFNVGTVSSGQYAGYQRVLGVATTNGPGGYSSLIFITNDSQKYHFDGSTLAAQYVDLTSPDNYINTAKVVGPVDTQSNFPKTINLANFVLVRQDVYLDGIKSEAVELSSNISGLKLFFEPTVSSTIEESIPADEKKLILTKQQFLASDTHILAQDSSGLTFSYIMTSQESYQRIKPNDYGYVSYDNFLLSNEIKAKTPLYKSYGQILPGGCGAVDVTYIVKNIQDSDLVQIATTSAGLKIYTLKDKNHPLNQAEYKAKTGYYFSEANNIPVPSYNSYVAKNPVLLLKDNWDRWLALGEVEYILPGGCGKPVVYLYPTKPTEVKINFTKAIIFSTVIPNYSNGWDILAQPNGELKDLQPQFTDCAKINSNKIGLEYAKAACAQNSYPYIYWSGQSLGGTYPKPNSGWIVAKDSLSLFLNNKLAEMGLNENEINDMVSYWVPALERKNSPYYRLSFLQTEELNKIIPMNVVPKPDTVFRIFLDWESLSNKPAQNMAPQNLAHLNRKGFTLVEWGGLKK